MTFHEKMDELKKEYPNLIRSGEVYCSICGNYETYYSEHENSILIRTCPTCKYIRVIDLSTCPSL